MVFHQKTKPRFDKFWRRKKSKNSLNLRVAGGLELVLDGCDDDALGWDGWAKMKRVLAVCFYYST